jgi:hypothetical protein
MDWMIAPCMDSGFEEVFQRVMGSGCTYDMAVFHEKDRAKAEQIVREREEEREFASRMQAATIDMHPLSLVIGRK